MISKHLEEVKFQNLFMEKLTIIPRKTYIFCFVYHHPVFFCLLRTRVLMKSQNKKRHTGYAYELLITKHFLYYNFDRYCLPQATSHFKTRTFFVFIKLTKKSLVQTTAHGPFFCTYPLYQLYIGTSTWSSLVTAMHLLLLA